MSCIDGMVLLAAGQRFPVGAQFFKPSPQRSITFNTIGLMSS